jgi:anaerobic magnesium-protoporphyrin IX monomethyl ester cyclase
MVDCLFVGMNSQNFSDYLTMVKGLGQDSGAFRDLNLSFIEYEGRTYQSMELLTHMYAKQGGIRQVPFHNADFIWPTITYLGTYLARRGFTFDYVNAFQYEKDVLRDKLTSEDILTVVIPTTLYVVPWPIQEIITFVRSHNEKARIIVGGPYIANLTKGGDREAIESQLRTIGADFYVISSEGEAALAALLRSLKTGSDLTTVNNLAYPEGGKFVFTKTATERNSLAENMVDYSLFSRDAIGQFISTRTAKSCPFACAFCNFPQQAGDYTYMPVELVERELNAIRDIGSVTTVTFIDDTFNVPKKRFAAILEMMIRNDYRKHFKWNCTLRSDHCDDEIVSQMGKAGCEGVFLGVESGSDRMLKTMNKTARRADYLWAIPRLKAEGILAHANVFIGFPGETLDTVEETVDLIRQTRPETFSAQPWYANPLTPVWKKREEYDIRGSSFRWSHRTMDAATACDLVDRVFLTIDESTFLPQYGFFQWSLFYLQRHGMSLDRLKNYLGAFNELVREKIVGATDEEVHARLVANLEAHSRFNEGGTHVTEIPPTYSGESRRAAEEYFIATFSEINVGSNGRALIESLEPVAETFGSYEITVPSMLRANLPAGATSAETLLAAFALLLWRLDELQDVALLVYVPEALPIALRPLLELTFETWVHEVRESLRSAQCHRLHAFDILSGHSKLLPFHRAAPRFRAAFRYGEAPALLKTPFANVPPEEDVLIEALVTERIDGPRLQLLLRGRCEATVLESLGGLLSTLLEEIAKRPAATLADLTIDGRDRVRPRDAIDVLSRETFEF